MRRRVTAVLAAICALCVPAVPQALEWNTRTQPATPDGGLTIVGCLMKVDRTAHRPGPSYSSTDGKGHNPALALGGAGSGFVLKDAYVVPAAAPAADSADSSGPSHRKGFQEFRVITADRNLKFADHVKTQVEVHGWLPKPEDPPQPAKPREEPRLNIGGNAVTVTAIKTIAQDCE